MNETPHPYTAADVPWPTSRPQAPLLDISMLNGSAALATPAPESGTAAAEQALQGKADALRETPHAWAEGLRATVRRNPLACLAAALAAGAVIARLTLASR